VHKVRNDLRSIIDTMALIDDIIEQGNFTHVTDEATKQINENMKTIENISKYC